LRSLYSSVKKFQTLSSSAVGYLLGTLTGGSIGEYMS